ncbi:MAG: hypothetical protein WAW13_00190 [Minisyncoccia bacterium]
MRCVAHESYKNIEGATTELDILRAMVDLTKEVSTGKQSVLYAEKFRPHKLKRLKYVQEPIFRIHNVS